MIDLTVCIGTSCHLSGAEMVIKSFQKLIKTNRLEKRINLQGTFCMGK
jgi:NADH:ubiquinone oxidoreductase subunit E